MSLTGSLQLPPLDCTIVLCALPVCSDGEKFFTPEGQCCPKCQPVPHPHPNKELDCAAVTCLALVDCPDGQVPVTPEGQCCPICQ